MIQLYYSYYHSSADWLGVELIKTDHPNGDNWHVRYGLQITHWPTHDTALAEMKSCIEHYCDCEQEAYTPHNFRDASRKWRKV